MTIFLFPAFWPVDFVEKMSDKKKENNVPFVEGAKKSELSVITKAKDLCSYIMTVTQKSPKQFRFSFVARMQNLALSIIENLYRANDIFVKKGDSILISQRHNKQREAMTDLRILGYFSMLAIEQKCILPKHYQIISEMIADCANLLVIWVASDKRRLQP